MAKALRTVAIVASAVAITVATAGALAPAATASALAALGVTASAASVAAIASATAAAASLGAQGLAKPRNDSQGTVLQYKIDPDGPIPFGMGRYATGGTIVHRNTYGKDNAYNTAFVVLGGGGPYAGIDTFLADRSPVSFSGTSALGYFSTWMWSDRQTGLTPEPDALTNGVPIAGQVPGWGAAYKLSGFAAASLTLKYDTKGKRYVQGEPLPGWIVRGMLVYDPAQDSTYPGGSGPCRWADPSDTAAHAAARQTWVYSNSPALHGLMWRLGIWARDENNSSASYQKIGGIGAPIDLIDLPAIVQARNVQIANGWTIGGEVNSDQDKWEVLKLIEQAGGCEPIAVGAKMSTLVKAPRVSLRTITATDLADGSISAPAMRARSERINGYRARFRSEPHGWEMTSIDIVQVPTYVTEDGRAKTGAGDFSLVTDPDQCAELAAYEVFDSRELEPITVNLKPFAVAYRLGDCLTLDIPEVGLESRMVIVRGRTVDPASGIVTLTCRSETTAKHPACLGLTGDTPPTPTLTSPPDSIDAPTNGAWSLSAPGLGTDYVTPTIIVSGSVENAAADAVLIEYRQSGTAEWIGSGVDAPTTTVKELTGLLKATAYEVSIRYRGRGIFSDRLVLGPITTADVSVGGEPGADGASAYTLANVANTTVGPAIITKTGGGNDWNGKARTLEGGAAATVSANLRPGEFIGLTTDPSNGSGFQTIDCALHWSANTRLYLYRDGQEVADLGGRTTDLGPIRATVRSDGSRAFYGLEGYELSSRTHLLNAPGASMYGSFAIFFEGSFIDGITYSVDGKAGADGRDGLDGTNGTNGLDGTNGQSIHIAYSDAADGSVNFTTGEAGGRTFIGVYTDTNPGADSTNPTAYGWTRLRGLDGTNGINGPGGYVHIAYANSADGTVDFHLSDPTGRAYIGTYTDQSAPDSTNPATYAWQLVKGADGKDGKDGANADQLGLGVLANGTMRLTIPSSGNTVITDYSSSINVTAGRQFRLTMSATNGSRNIGSNVAVCNLSITLGSQTVFSGAISVDVDNTIFSTAIDAAVARLVGNSVSGPVQLVISHTRAGPIGNSADFDFSFILERV